MPAVVPEQPCIATQAPTFCTAQCSAKRGKVGRRLSPLGRSWPGIAVGILEASLTLRQLAEAAPIPESQVPPTACSAGLCWLCRQRPDNRRATVRENYTVREN